MRVVSSQRILSAEDCLENVIDENEKTFLIFKMSEKMVFLSEIFVHSLEQYYICNNNVE